MGDHVNVGKRIVARHVAKKELEIEGMLINWGMAKQFVVYECNGILLCYKK